MSMVYRRLGSSGLQVSALSFGAWITFGKQIGDPVARELMHTAYDAGVNFFDNAEAYAEGRAESVMGDILRKSGWRRESFVVSSKVFWGTDFDGPNGTGLSRKHVFEACHAALRRLQVDHLDLYFCHRPDPNTPIAETVRAMHDLVTQGKVLYWGTSEWRASHLTEAFALCDKHGFHRPAMEQPEYNLLHRTRFERELTPILESHGMGTTTWSPLASGLLTGKYVHGVPADSRLNVPGLEWLRETLTGPGGEAKLAAVGQLAAVAADLGTTLPRLGVAWCLKNPRVSSVILGASRVEQLRENLGALDIVPRLTPEIMARIEKISGPAAD